MAVSNPPSRIVTRVLEVLCDGATTAQATSLARNLAVNRFRRSPGRAPVEEMPSSSGHAAPMVEVLITPGRWSEAEPMNITANLHRRTFDVILRVIYALGGGDYGASPAGHDRQSVAAKAADDALDILFALSCPGLLATTTAGAAATGLASGMLVDGEASEVAFDTEGNLALMVMRFVAHVEITTTVA